MSEVKTLNSNTTIAIPLPVEVRKLLDLKLGQVAGVGCFVVQGFSF